MSDPIVFPFKCCSKCGQEYPVTSDFFHRNKNKPDGLSGVCKSCACQRSRDWHKNNPERTSENGRRYYQEHREHHLEMSRQWAEQNPDQSRAIKRRYYDANRAAVIEASRQWRLNNPERQRVWAQNYRQRNRSTLALYHRRYYAQHFVKHNQLTKRWRINNPEKASHLARLRRARLRTVPATLTLEDWQYALNYFGGGCAICGRHESSTHFIAQDHWIPLSKGGGTTPDNIIPLCHGTSGCNNSKFNHMPDKWLIETFGEEKAKETIAKIQAYFDHIKRRGKP